MAIGKSKLHAMLKRRRLLSEALVWFESIDTDIKQEIIRLIQQEQLLKQGIDGTGEVIGYYSLATERMNPEKRFNTPFTLFDKGYFFKSTFVSVFIDAILVDANSESFAEMKQQDWYTDKILTLTDENMEVIKQKIKAKYIARIRAVLFEY